VDGEEQRERVRQGGSGAIPGGGDFEVPPLRVCVERAMERYFEHLDGEPARDLYAFVLGEVEAPLLECVMKHAGGNQSRAAEMLGLSRGTLRKKLKHYGQL